MIRSGRLGKSVLQRGWKGYESLARQRRFALFVFGTVAALSIGLLLARQPWRVLGETTWPCGFEPARVARNLLQGYGYSSPFALLPGDRLWVGPRTDGTFAPPLRRLAVNPGGRLPPTAWVTPPNVALWMLVFWLFGIYTPAAWAAYLLLQVGLMASTAYLLWRTLGLAAGERAAAFGLLLLAGYAPAWFLAIDDTHGTVLFIWLLACGYYGLARRIQGGGPGWLGLHAAGVVLAILAEPSTILFLAVFEFWLVRWGPLRKQGGRLLLAVGLAALLVWGPWMVRNWRVFGKPMYLKSNLGMELWYGNNRVAAQEGFIAAQDQYFVVGNETERRILLEVGEPAYSELCLQRALAYVTAHPAATLALTARRVLYFWTWLPGKANPGRLLFSGMFLVCLTLLGSLWIRERRRGRTAVSAAPVSSGWCWLETAAVLCLCLYPMGYYATHFLLYRYRFFLEWTVLLALACAASRAWPPQDD
jgi:hypothetical protein